MASGQPAWVDGPFGQALRLDGKEGAFVDAGQAAAAERNRPLLLRRLGEAARRAGPS